jgi:hypothetical protein
MSLDLNKLENKLDEALSNETSETLNKFLTDKRMTNNKQQTAVEWFIEELEYKGDLRETPSIRNIQLNIDTSDYMELKVQAQEMDKEQKEISYADGYKEGYQRALDYMSDAIKEKIEIKENGRNNFARGTANTTHTTFLCTEFVSDQLFYKGTLPHCMRCGKPEYQHPIITNTI